MERPRSAPGGEVGDERGHIHAEPRKVEAAIVRHAVDGQQPLLQALHRRPSLPALGVIGAYRHLKEESDKLKLIAHRLEEQLLETVACLQVVAGVELFDGRGEARIVFGVHVV